MNPTTETAAARIIVALRNPCAIRSGELTHVTFIIEGDHAIVSYDDCVSERWLHYSRENARQEYQTLVSSGFRPAMCDTAQILRRYSRWEAFRREFFLDI